MASTINGSHPCFRCHQPLQNQEPLSVASWGAIVKPPGCNHFQHLECVQHCVLSRIGDNPDLADRLNQSRTFEVIEVPCQDQCPSTLRMQATAYQNQVEEEDSQENVPIRYLVCEALDGMDQENQLRSYTVNQNNELIEAHDLFNLGVPAVHDDALAEPGDEADLASFPWDSALAEQIIGMRPQNVIDARDVQVTVTERIHGVEISCSSSKPTIRKVFTLVAFAVAGLAVFFFASPLVALFASLALPVVLFGGVTWIDRNLNADQYILSLSGGVDRRSRMNFQEFTDEYLDIF